MPECIKNKQQQHIFIYIYLKISTGEQTHLSTAKYGPVHRNQRNSIKTLDKQENGCVSGYFIVYSKRCMRQKITNIGQQKPEK